MIELLKKPISKATSISVIYLTLFALFLGTTGAMYRDYEEGGVTLARKTVTDGTTINDGSGDTIQFDQVVTLDPPDKYSNVYFESVGSGTTLTTYLIGIDISDVTNYPHTTTGGVVVKNVNGKFCLENAGHWVIRVAVIESNTVATGTAAILWSNQFMSAGCHDFQMGARTESLDFALDGSTLNNTNSGTGIRLVNDTSLGTSDTTYSFMGQTVGPGEGDVMFIFFNIDSGDANPVHFNATITYEVKP